MLAFYFALLLDMPRPYWAMTSVYVTSNVLTGATSSKAVYRILGTLIGAAGAIALVPNLVDAPELLSLAIAVWVGAFLYIALLDGTPRGYVFMLAGYTIAIVGLPVLSTPELTFDVAVSRVQEITLGIICASVFSMLVLPRSVASAVAGQADAWLANASLLCANVLIGGSHDPKREDERMRLAAAASAIDELCNHLDYDAATSASIVRGLQRLRRHMLALLPMFSSIEDRMVALDSGGGMPVNLAMICARIANWLTDGSQGRAEADLIRTALAEVRPALYPDADWTGIMAASLVNQLRNLIDIMQDCRALRLAIAEGRDPEQLTLAFTLDVSGHAAAHRDRGIALWSAAATTLSLLACFAFWIGTGWADGTTAALFSAILGTLLASADEPLPVFRNLYKAVIVVVALNGIYIFGILPRVTTIEMLMAALMPMFLLFGWMAARPATAAIGALLANFIAVQLTLQPFYTADFASFANSSVALMLGVGLTGVISGIVRFFGTDWIARRLLRSNRETLAAVAVRKSWQDRVAVASLMQHRLALLAQRIAAVPAEAKSDAANLRLLRTALNIIDVRQASLDLSLPARSAIEMLLARLAAIFATPGAGQLPDDVLGQLDSTIPFTLREPASETRNQAVIALAGIRSGLFPEAPAYQPLSPEPREIAA
ncbi:p-hydroxybenzoic acid efflux pump subunit AaeB [Bradyrhizobium ivorense]|uniref:p-hydroxybenzoic acid efflux pump subunit AaeB n=2 Tax=Bradyrhizobium ivorense TaxID=2511166 RepID=A0A508TC43_9BRAD|nr:p-hydroxybenzoic acid efflux pump subunit AaeB [Bradyrhizobium ivorense]